jgi:hypothetical protein
VGVGFFIIRVDRLFGFSELGTNYNYETVRYYMHNLLSIGFYLNFGFILSLIVSEQFGFIAISMEVKN